MPFLCFLVPLLYSGLFMWPEGTPKLAVLGLMVPILVSKFRGPPEGLLFLLWTLLASIWSTSVYDWIGEIAWLLILAGTFCIEADPRRCLTAFSAGMALNFPVVIAQKFHWLELITTTNWPPGLFVNSNYLAASSCLALVAMICLRNWWLAVPILGNIALSGSKGAMVSLSTAAGLWLWKRNRAATVVLALAVAAGMGLYAMNAPWRIFGPRMEIYETVISHLRFFGWGTGSFWSAYPMIANPDTSSVAVFGFQMRPQNAHSDFLTILFQYGVPGALLALLFVARIATVRIYNRTDHACRYVFAAFLGFGFFDFPLFIYATGFVAAFCAGHLYRLGSDVRSQYRVVRLPLCRSES